MKVKIYTAQTVEMQSNTMIFFLFCPPISIEEHLFCRVLASFNRFKPLDGISYKFSDDRFSAAFLPTIKLNILGNA